MMDDINELRTEIEYVLSSCNKYNGINDCGTCELLNNSCQCTLAEVLTRELYNSSYITKLVKDSEENKKLKKEVVSLKQDLEVAKDNELYLKTINELREENKRLKDMKFRQYVATDEKGNIVDYAIFDHDKVYPLKEYLEIVKQHTVKEVVEKLKADIYHGIELPTNAEVITVEDIDTILKEYNINENKE